MADLYLTPAEKYTAALGGFYYGDLPEPGTVYTQLIKYILDGSTPDKEPKNVLARFIYSLYISDLGDPYPRYELAKLLYWKLHNITPTKSGSVLTVTIDGKEDYMTINTDLSRLWYKVLFGSKTDVITEFPYTFNTMQTKLSDWEIFGNTVQSGTPTPDSPVIPHGTGERTGNLCEVIMDVSSTEKTSATDVSIAENAFFIKHADTTTTDTAFRILSKGINLESGTYTLSFDMKTNIQNYYLQSSEQKTTKWATGLYKDGISFGNIRNIYVSSSDVGKWVRYSIQITVDAGEYMVNIAGDAPNLVTGDEVLIKDIMLNLGSEALHYEPYGYKIPISSAGQTASIYLGEVETTRKIKKLVLDGTEDWKINAKAAPPNNIAYIDLDNVLTGIAPICTHYVGTDKNTWLSLQLNDITVSIVGGSVIRCAVNVGGTSLNDFKSYLAQQYAAGTPVTVWYVLAEPEKGVINEPLMKIGDYADSMSMLKTGIDIPTVIGQNTLDVLATIKPSSMRIEYTSADENKSRSKRISLLKRPLAKSIKA